ncbi:right-handed parallel beta-helix repeat-containing protein [Pseudoalteromonas rubra]|uniref:right-handed parallel beta-helix repeat-containing protein n=1 Tax=Pseudoalteromonas rubra TaxID=43658 RepID=UPI000F782DE6|nr:right-handed parallel beta-helix repeat-containing protein [Pseudoalteromonas rubra]
MIQKIVKLLFFSSCLVFLSSIKQAQASNHCESPQPSSIDSNNTLILHSNSFWETQNLGDYGDNVDAIITDMPEALKNNVNMSDYNRAEQLRWAIRVANNITPRPAHTKVMVASCDYNFSEQHNAHPDTPVDGIHNAFLPKLFIKADNITIEGVSDQPTPRLYYSGKGFDGQHHGRVVLMVPSKTQGITIKNLSFEGDHHWNHIQNPAYTLHENNDNLYFNGRDRRLWSGMIMIGLAGGSNDVTVDNVSIQDPARSGIAIVGNATIQNSVIKGSIPLAHTENMLSELLNASGALSAHLNINSAGMGFHSGIAQQFSYGPIHVKNNTIQNFVEGVNGNGQEWVITGNTIKEIADHAIYILSNMKPSIIEHNKIEMILSAAIKLGGRTCLDSATQCMLATDPLAEPTRAGAYKTRVQFNTFKLIPRTSVLLSGTFNTIANNTIVPYNPADDTSTGNFYNPAKDPTNVYPDFFFSTSGGQTQKDNQGHNYWTNHFAYNTVAYNTKGSEELSVFISQRMGHRDRSIGMNVIKGPGQKVYFHARKDSRYAPLISVSAGTTLYTGGKPDCIDCIGNPVAQGYRSNLEPLWAKAMTMEDSNGRDVPHLLVKLDNTEEDVFLIGESGIHERINAENQALDIKAVADLDGDGIDEIYFQDNSTGLSGARLFLTGSEVENRKLNDIASTRWTFHNANQDDLVASQIASLKGAEPDQLITNWAGSSELLGSAFDGLGNPVSGNAIYHGAHNTSVNKLQAADLSGVGEIYSANQELYVALDDKKVIGVYWDAHTSSWKNQTVYSGTQTLSLMEPGRLRSTEPKQRMYQRYSSNTIYESRPASSGSLPAFGSGSYFYNGSATSDMLVAADLNDDGKQEMISHFSQVTNKIYYGQEMNGVLNSTQGTIYDGFTSPKLITPYNSADKVERVISLFNQSWAIYLSEGLRSNGHNYVNYIYSKALANTH